MLFRGIQIMIFSVASCSAQYLRIPCLKQIAERRVQKHSISNIDGCRKITKRKKRRTPISVAQLLNNTSRLLFFDRRERTAYLLE